MSESIFSLKGNWKAILNFNLIFFILLIFGMMIIFQFFPQLAEKNCLLFYESTLAEASITLTGWTIIIIFISFFIISLVLGYLGMKFGYVFGFLGMIALALFFYAGTFILFNNVISP